MPYCSPRVLIFGHRSFASQGLRGLLSEKGYDVTCFSRGNVEKTGSTITGPVNEIAANPYLDRDYDVVINYILLSDLGIAENEEYLCSLLNLCQARNVKLLIHISSISVYREDAKLITEDASVETNPLRKGAYGSLKVTQDEYLKRNQPQGMKLSFLRPGFILGHGLLNPIVGTGFRTPWNKLVAIGNAGACLPLVSRDTVHQAILRIIENPPGGDREVFLLADSSSPTRKEYLNACAEVLGCGVGAMSFPTILWLLAAVGGECLLRLLGKGEMKVYQKIRAACRSQRFNSEKTSKRLEIGFSLNWRSELRRSMDSQDPGFDIPPQFPRLISLSNLGKITFVGCGRIVRDRHLPSLKRLGFKGIIEAYDQAKIEQAGVRTIASEEISASDLYVIATPGPAHKESVQLVQHFEGRVLVEKPLCYHRDDLDDLLAMSKRCVAGIFVCHNYRFKSNVLSMLDHLRRFNPGKLCHVSVDFQSPPVSHDGALWLRNERRARTLLMDYSLHFLDLACMFGEGPWKASEVRHETNSQGQTSLIVGQAFSDLYGVSFLLRQGFIPRKAHLTFTFQNYAFSLRFFPDTCQAHMSNDNYWVHKRESRKLFSATISKIIDKLTSRDRDQSHAFAYLAACGVDKGFGTGISVEHLRHFYELMFQLADAVYSD